MSIEAMKQALEALSDFDYDKRMGAITSLRQAIAEAEKQEPVAWVNWCAATGKWSVSFECESELASQPLYFGVTQNTQDRYSNQKREPLTDEQIMQAAGDTLDVYSCARAIEVAHGIKGEA